MRKIKCADIVQDLSFYPRCGIDWSHVDSLASAIEAGAEMPPIVVCSKTRKVVDGIHRMAATMRARGADADIDVIEKDYPDQRAMFLDAIRYNAKHGQPLSHSDRQHCLLSCAKFGCDDLEVAGAIGITTRALGALRGLGTSSRPPTLATHRRDPEPADEEVADRHRKQSKVVADARQKIVDAAIAWHRATEEAEMDRCIDELSVSVQQYLRIQERRAA